MPPFRDDQIMIIAPGSQTTLAQLGLPESLTPARFHFRSCMFPAEEEGEYEPNKIRRKEKQHVTNGGSSAGGDGQDQKPQSNGEDGPAYEEDFISEEGAVWPIKSGQIVDWPCFYALLTYIYNTINPPFHTPILFVAEPVWTTKTHERITQFFFEKFKTPAFGLMDAAMATSYAFGLQNATIVDVGHDKADVTAISDFLMHTTGRAIAVPGCGGESMTERLTQLLGSKGFTRDMAEQLKRSPICEVLPSDADHPTSDGTNPDAPSNPAAAASTGSNDAAMGDVSRGPAPKLETSGDMKEVEDSEGVLDVASIVTGGNMKEYLEKKEQEKAERVAAKKKGADAAGTAPKPVRLANSRRAKNTFTYEDQALHNALKDKGVSGSDMAAMQSAMNQSNSNGEQAAPNGTRSAEGTITREIEVGLERFQAASGGILDTLADTIYRTVSAVETIGDRSSLWESLVVVGNGAKIRGFKEALLSTLQAKYLISPSSATIFTSELPSNMSTPLATGMNTPMPLQHTQSQQTPGQPGPGGSHVNPLLLAATTANNPHFQPQQSQLQSTPGGLQMPQIHHQNTHVSHAQTPTAIKLAKMPDYFPEWKEVGYDEAVFLGAQVAAKVLFGDAGVNKGYMTRTDYNEQGPQGIHDCSI